MKQNRTIDIIRPILSETIPDTVGPIIIPIIAATVRSSSIHPFLQTRLFSVVTDTLTYSLLDRVQNNDFVSKDRIQWQIHMYEL